LFVTNSTVSLFVWLDYKSNNQSSSQSGLFVSNSGINFYNNSNIYYIETPENTDFSGEGGGLGRLVGEASIVTKGAPALFTGILWEEGGGDRYFAIATVDWNKDPEDWAAGREWYFTQSLENFIGHVA